MKQIINVSDVVATLPGVVTVSVDQFLSSRFENAYVLIDRSCVSSKEIFAIKQHCQEIGLNPCIDGGNMDASIIYLQDWNEADEVKAVNDAILNGVRALEEAETQRKIYELDDAKTLPIKAVKLIKLAKDRAASFGEKRNAISAAYNLVFNS